MSCLIQTPPGTSPLFSFRHLGRASGPKTAHVADALHSDTEFYLLSICAFLKLATGSDEYCEGAVGCVEALTGLSLSVFHIAFCMWLWIIWVVYVNRRQMGIGCQVVILKRRSFIAFFKMHDIKDHLE